MKKCLYFVNIVFFGVLMLTLQNSFGQTKPDSAKKLHIIYNLNNTKLSCAFTFNDTSVFVQTKSNHDQYGIKHCLYFESGGKKEFITQNQIDLSYTQATDEFENKVYILGDDFIVVFNEITLNLEPLASWAYGEHNFTWIKYSKQYDGLFLTKAYGEDRFYFYNIRTKELRSLKSEYDYVLCGKSQTLFFKDNDILIGNEMDPFKTPKKIANLKKIIKDEDLLKKKGRQFEYYYDYTDDVFFGEYFYSKFGFKDNKLYSLENTYNYDIYAKRNRDFRRKKNASIWFRDLDELLLRLNSDVKLKSRPSIVVSTSSASMYVMGTCDYKQTMAYNLELKRKEAIEKYKIENTIERLVFIDFIKDQFNLDTIPEFNPTGKAIRIFSEYYSMTDLSSSKKVKPDYTKEPNFYKKILYIQHTHVYDNAIFISRDMNRTWQKWLYPVHKLGKITRAFRIDEYNMIIQFSNHIVLVDMRTMDIRKCYQVKTPNSEKFIIGDDGFSLVYFQPYASRYFYYDLHTKVSIVHKTDSLETEVLWLNKDLKMLIKKDNQFFFFDKATVNNMKNYALSQYKSTDYSILDNFLMNSKDQHNFIIRDLNSQKQTKVHSNSNFDYTRPWEYISSLDKFYFCNSNFQSQNSSNAGLITNASYKYQSMGYNKDYHIWTVLLKLKNSGNLAIIDFYPKKDSFKVVSAMDLKGNKLKIEEISELFKRDIEKSNNNSTSPSTITTNNDPRKLTAKKYRVCSYLVSYRNNEPIPKNYTQVEKVEIIFSKDKIQFYTMYSRDLLQEVIVQSSERTDYEGQAVEAYMGVDKNGKTVIVMHFDDMQYGIYIKYDDINIRYF